MRHVGDAYTTKTKWKGHVQATHMLSNLKVHLEHLLVVFTVCFSLYCVVKGPMPWTLVLTAHCCPDNLSPSFNFDCHLLLLSFRNIFSWRYNIVVLFCLLAMSTPEVHGGWMCDPVIRLCPQFSSLLTWIFLESYAWTGIFQKFYSTCIWHIVLLVLNYWTCFRWIEPTWLLFG